MAEAPSSSPVLTVYTFGPGSAGDVFVPDQSPFCHKVLAHLVLTDTNFKVCKLGDKDRPANGPKNKTPFVKFPDGQMLGDSQMIIDELDRRSGTSFNAHLSPQQRATSHLVRRTLEESFYWNCCIEKRWRREAHNKKYMGVIFAPLASTIPCCFAPFIPCIMRQARKGVKKSYEAQGMGRHTEAEVTKLAMADLRAIEASMGSGPFFHGEHKSSIDIVVYAFILTLKYQKAMFAEDSKEQEVDMQEIPKLLAHCDHMDQLVGPKLKEIMGV